MHIMGPIGALLLAVVPLGRASGVVCGDGSLATAQYSAMHNGTEMKVWSCPTNLSPFNKGNATRSHLDTDRVNLCPAACVAHCAKSTGEGPNPQDCYTLAKYYSKSGRFTIRRGRHITWAYGTCRVTQYNHLDRDISYCYDQRHWAGVVDRLASRCRLRNNDKGGSCHFYDDDAQGTCKALPSLPCQMIDPDWDD